MSNYPNWAVLGAVPMTSSSTEAHGFGSSPNTAQHGRSSPSLPGGFKLWHYLDDLLGIRKIS
ncbi:hypothetical protein E2C01_022958 [Portunus trituberculatus]|uniref:Uncharacterized protein n=1 Tax=Portunus trituberculatus TaxID=210409 RepID=A0A5B7E6S2_PORTR|nr:hypothetical protein [Portunus trituberculatus]